jgi:hypothetical protein
LARLARGLLLSALLATAGMAHAAEPARSPVTEAAEDALWEGDFAALERQYAEARQPGRFDADGRSQLVQFRQGFQRVVRYADENAEPYLKEMDALTLQWAQEHPGSALAHILHAKALEAHAWSYRGGGYAKDVPPEAWKDFNAYLEQAAVYLKDHADVALKDSYAHLVLLQIGRGLGWSRTVLAAIASDGLQRNPDDTDLYYQMVTSLVPKWGGDANALDAYIRSAAEQTRARYGMALYAQLYMGALFDQYGHALFEDSHADWSKMKQGFEDILARYPDSSIYLNEYAYTACLAKDKATLVKALGRVGANTRLDVWGPNPERSLETCRRWAAQQVTEP